MFLAIFSLPTSWEHDDLGFTKLEIISCGSEHQGEPIILLVVVSKSALSKVMLMLNAKKVICFVLKTVSDYNCNPILFENICKNVWK